MATEQTDVIESWDNPRYGRRTRRLLYLKHLCGGILDNPIFVKHKRTRLRKAQIMPTLSVIGVLCICIAYGGYALNGFANGGVFSVTMVLQSIILAIMGSTQIGASVGGARESGIIDYHRVSPMSPFALTMGFFFGAPIREYVLYAMTLPLALICVFFEAPGIQGFFEATVALFLSALTMHAMALLTSLTTKKPKVGGKGIIALIIFLFFFGGNFGFLAFRRIAGSLNEGWSMKFFGIELHWLLFTLLYSMPFLVFLLLASVRKMRSEKAHPYTKPEAILAVSILSLLLIGALWGMPAFANTMVLAVIYVLLAVSLVLITTVTPSQGEFTKGIRRAEREGKPQVDRWSDWSLNRLTVVIFAAIMLAACTFVTQTLSTTTSIYNTTVAPPEFSYSISVATGMFVLVYSGLAFQAFQLIMPRRGGTMFALFLFIAWLVPIMVGSISAASGLNQVVSNFILALSPITGIALSAGIAESDGTRLFQAAAFCPAVVFAFVFNNLVVIFRRRAIASVHAAAVKPKLEPVELG